MIGKVDRSLGFNITFDADTKRAENKVGAFAQSMQRRIERAVRSLPSIELDASSSKADRRIAEIQIELAALSDKRIGIDIDAATAHAQVERLRSELVQLGSRHPNVQVRADTARAAAQLAAVSGQARRLDGQTVNIAVNASDVARTISLLGLLTAGLAGVGAMVAPAAAALAALPALAGVAAQGVGALATGFSGVGGAVKALQAEETKAAAGTAASAASRVSSANAIISAQRAVEQAVIQAGRTEITSAEQVADARAQVAEAYERGLEQVATAEQAYTQAQEEARLAQDDLTRARAEATEGLEDLDRALRGSALSEQEAAIRLAEAQERYQAARQKGTSGREIDKLRIDAEQAALALEAAEDRHEDLREETEAANRAGVEGSDRVTEARRRAEQATAREKQAERELGKARDQAVKDNTRAQEQLARTIRQAQWAQQDADRQVGDAQRNLKNAYADTGTAGAASANKVKEAMAGLSPEAQQFAKFLVSEVVPGLKQIRAEVQASLLPKMETSMRNLSVLGPDVADGLADTADVIGDLSIKGSEMMTSGPWRADFRTMLDTNNRILGDFGEAGLDVLDVLRNIGVTSLPMVERWSRWTERVAEQTRVFIENKRATGELDEFFDRMGDTLAEVGSIVADIVVGTYQLTTTMGPLGMVLLRTVADLVGWIGEIARANPELAQLIGTMVIGIATFNAIGKAAAGAALAAGVATGGWKTLIGVIGGLSPVAIASSAAMQAAQRGMDAAALSAGTFTERMTGSANAGEKVASAGGKVSSALTKIGASLPVVGAVLIGATLAYDGLTTSSSEAAEALLSGGKAAADMRAELAKGDAEAQRIGFGYGALRTKLSDAEEEMHKVRMAQDPLTRATQDAARAQKDYLFALESGDMPAAEDALRRFTTATEEQSRQQRILDQDLRATNVSLEEQIGIVLGAVESEIRYQDAVDRASRAVLENGRTHDLNTEAGRRNTQALIDMSRSAADNLEAMRRNGASAEEMRRFHDSARQELIRQAGQMGFNAGEAQKLADKYLGVRNIGTINTTFVANTFPAVDAVFRMRDEINRAVQGITNEDIILRFKSDTGNILNAATGGAVLGPGTETSDSIPARLSHNEHVWTGREVRGAGGHSNVYRLRKMAAAGRLPGFAAGGPVQWSSAETLLSAGIPEVAQTNARVIEHLIKKEFAGGGSALAFARAQAGKPYIWGGVGPAGWDCSGFMSSITRVLRKQSPYARVGATGNFPWPGFRPGSSGLFVIGSTRDAGGGIGHMAGTLGGVNVESRGGEGVVVGPRARGAAHPLFNQRAAFVADRGGWLRPGASALNLSARPERVLSPSQTAAFEQLVRVLTTRAGAAPIMVSGGGSTLGSAGGGVDWPSLVPVLRAAVAGALERVFAGGLKTDVDFDGLSLRLNRVAAINRRR